MLFKALILVVFAGIVVSLFTGFFFLLHDPSHKKRTLHALMTRVLLSVLLILLLIYGYWYGLIPGHA